MMETVLEWLARRMAATHLNRVWFILEAGRPYVLKRRRWFSPLLIFFGNGVSRVRRVPVIVLQNRAWRAWEARVNPLVNGFDAVCDGRRRLRVERAAGEPLQQILAAPRHGLEQKAEAIAAAARAMRALHAAHLPAGGQALSHGDATVRNVAYDFASGRAQWFDFDLAHDLRTSAALRHADDLRALIFSAAPLLAAAELPPIAEALLEAYGASPALAALERLVADPRLDTDLYHRAQTLAGASQRRACRAALLHALRRAGLARAVVGC